MYKISQTLLSCDRAVELNDLNVTFFKSLEHLLVCVLLVEMFKQFLKFRVRRYKRPLQHI
jgi:hypothetical protein